MERELAVFVRGEIAKHRCISMMTFNGGSRWREGAATDRLKEGRQSMRRAMTTLFRSKEFRKYFDVIYIGEEYGTPKAKYSRRRGNWKFYMHTHAHILVRVVKRVTDFNRLMTWVRLRYHGILTKTKFPGLIRLLDFDNPLTPEFSEKVKGWMESAQALPLVEYDGKICDVQEACKYPMKDKDLTMLEKEGGAQPIRDLYENLFRARLCTPKGEFREWRKRELYQRKGFRRKITAKKSPQGDSFYRFTRDWNCQTPNSYEADLERKKRDAERKRLAAVELARINELRNALKSCLGEWERFQKNAPPDFQKTPPPISGNRPGTGDYEGNFQSDSEAISEIAPPDFEKSPRTFIKSFPRNDFQIDGFYYKDFTPEFCLKREICFLVRRLIGSAILFDIAIPAFVLKELQFPEHVAEENAVFGGHAKFCEDFQRQPVRNMVTARIAPSFVGGGTICRPGIVVIGATDDGRVWRNNALARRLERVSRPLIDEAVAQARAEAALPDFAPPAADADDDEAGPCACTRASLTGGSQTPLNFPFYELGPPGNGPGNEEILNPVGE
jgi:hypothetical protein